ncbi:NAD(P)H-dependent flavin oxidoreductase [Actinomadura monticuli]|uniref:Nitronate monooxygenase n=1 Tax=Actinomadura monticuli TaxID=3097367 RepID=A0ABV4Q3T9_9ACTN
MELPIVQAPIGSAVTPELVAAVSNAGGLGMLALTWVSEQEAVRRIQRVRELTDRPFGVNLVLDFPVDHLLTACLKAGVAVVSTFWGHPGSVSERVRPVDRRSRGHRQRQRYRRPGRPPGAPGLHRTDRRHGGPPIMRAAVRPSAVGTVLR